MARMSRASIRGLVAPLLTPFDNDQSIATVLFVDHAKRLLDRGCSGLVPFGTTGEALSVGIDERIAAVSSLVDAGVDPACMIPGTGVSNVVDTARLSRACLDLGCAGVLVLRRQRYYSANRRRPQLLLVRRQTQPGEQAAVSVIRQFGQQFHARVPARCRTPVRSTVRRSP